MLIGVVYFAIAGGASIQTDTIIAGAFSITWLVIGFWYLYIRKLITGETILHSEDYKEKSGSTVSVNADR